MRDLSVPNLAPLSSWRIRVTGREASNSRHRAPKLIARILVITSPCAVFSAFNSKRGARKERLTKVIHNRLLKLTLTPNERFKVTFTLKQRFKLTREQRMTRKLTCNQRLKLKVTCNQRLVNSPVSGTL